MNIIISSSTAARNEISEVSAVSNWVISHINSTPAIGQVDDSVIGMAELTRSNVKFDKYHAMMLFQDTTKLPTFTEDTYTGRDCISKSLADTPINFTRTASWYNPDMAPYIKYKADEIKVKIEQGKHISGILDKKSIRAKQGGNIYHIVANEYGNKPALDLMFNHQQMANSYLCQYGFTVGIMDMMIPIESKVEIDTIAADIINKSAMISEDLQNGEIIPPIGKTVEQHFEEAQINALRVTDDFTNTILSAINPETNNLFKLIMFGSKGDLNNMFNMISSVGQKLINGERIRQKFGFKRTLAYFPRFDTSPESRGYIKNSYFAGMNSREYISNAMAARFDLISKALSTSITGEQNRKSIKNLESIIINNFRMAVKNRNITQFAYGGDFLDPRKVERVRFPSVMITDAVLAEKYSHKEFPEEFQALIADREKYRTQFMTVEKLNTKELMTDERFMPVHVERMINDIMVEYSDELVGGNKLADLVSMVNGLVTGIPYILVNEIAERRKIKLPAHIIEASWLMCMLVRIYLNPIFLETSRMTKTVLDIIIKRIRLRYSQALIEPGTAVGIIAAQAFSGPLTQYMLDAHHRSAAGGTSKSGMTKARETLSAKPVAKLIDPGMIIPIMPEFSHDKNKVQEIANGIEVMKLERFVPSWQIFFEKYGTPVHSAYVHEAAVISEFNRLNPLLSVPGDLIRWCIRVNLNKTTMILKNMSIDLIVTKLREAYPKLYVVYTPENSQNLFLRIYMQVGIVTAVNKITLSKLANELMTTIIRGVRGIISTKVIKLIRNKVAEDGSIVRDDQWGISTVGTNLSGIFDCKYVDKYGVQTEAIQEMDACLGIMAANMKTFTNMRDLVPDINSRHYATYANEMTFTGKVTSIESSGLRTREASNVLLRIGFSSPMGTIEEAAMNSMEDAVTGITAPLLLGTIPQIGTLFNSFHVDPEFVRKNIKRGDDIVNELF